MTPTGDYPSLVFYGKIPSIRPINLVTHRVFSQVIWSTSESPIKTYWKHKFGRIPDHFGNPFFKQVTRRYPTIISSSKHVFPPPSDQPEHVHTTGYWFLDEPEDWSPPGDMVKFLETGEPPVYIGFGSLGSDSSEKLTSVVSEGLRLAGKRGILATGWGGLEGNSNEQDLYFVKSIPHSWLFRRTLAVIHHGGAGTTAAGLRAGVPSIIIPFSNDQFAWARRVHDLGVGSEPLSVKNLTAQKLADAISAATSSQTIEKARNLGKKINGEDGANNAARVVLRALE
jgi:sterol 3beta-glucosyltransferase